MFGFIYAMIILYTVIVSNIVCTIDIQLIAHQSDLSPVHLSCIINYCNRLFDGNKIKPSSVMVIVPHPNHSSIQTIIMQSISSNSLMIFDKPSIGKNAKQSPSNYLIFIDAIDDVAAIGTIISSMPNSNFLAPIITVFPNFSAVTNMQFQVKTIFERLLLQNYINLYAILIKPETIEMVTWYPYENNNCAKLLSEVKTIEFCNKNISDQEKVLTTKKFDNKKNVIDQTSNKCPLKILARIWEPYVGVEIHYGIDIQLLEFILKSLNMVPIYYTINKSIERKSNYIEELTKR